MRQYLRSSFFDHFLHHGRIVRFLGKVLLLELVERGGLLRELGLEVKLLAVEPRDGSPLLSVEKAAVMQLASKTLVVSRLYRNLRLMVLAIARIRSARINVVDDIKLVL